MPPEEGGQHEAMMGHILSTPGAAEKVGLTPEQAERLRDSMLEARERQIDLRAAMEKAALRQARLLVEEDVNEDEVMELVEQMGRIRTEMARIRMQQLLMMRRALSPEQMGRIREWLRERAPGRREREERGPAPGGEQGPMERRGWREREGERRPPRDEEPPPPRRVE
jgi:Spy/CpxP family protein refolding chaperone